MHSTEYTRRGSARRAAMAWSRLLRTKRVKYSSEVYSQLGSQWLDSEKISTRLASAGMPRRWRIWGSGRSRGHGQVPLEIYHGGAENTEIINHYRRALRVWSTVYK